jgi:hypothetical protein
MHWPISRRFPLSPFLLLRPAFHAFQAFQHFAALPDTFLPSPYSRCFSSLARSDDKADFFIR